MCCDRERSTLKGYYQNGGGDSQLRKQARELDTNLLGLCGVLNSYRTHTASLLAGQTSEGARMKQIWETQREQANRFIATHRLSPPSQ